MKHSKCNLIQTQKMKHKTVEKGKFNRSYTQEFKLSVIKWFRENGGNVLQTSRSREFTVDRKLIHEWVNVLVEKICQGKLFITSMKISQSTETVKEVTE